MTESEGKERRDVEERGPTFAPVSGSLIGGMSREKSGRITEAMQDIQLVVDGLRMRLAESSDGERLGATAATFARACSVFLRKTVLGDFGKRETRLLDDRVLDELGLRFHRLRKIPQDKRRLIKVGFSMSGGGMAATRLNDVTREPERTYVFHAAPQSLEIAIEWPLPGTASWSEAPSDEEPWLVTPDQLFKMDEEPEINCDEWLGQQVVLFDGKGISLKAIIQTVVNFEGAHSINTSRLFTVEGEKPSRAAANPAPHILNAVTLFGIRYAHLIVIESAMYLYGVLSKQDAVKRSMGEIYSIELGVECTPEQAESPNPVWLQFQGSMAISFVSTPTLIRHEIRAGK